LLRMQEWPTLYPRSRISVISSRTISPCSSGERRLLGIESRGLYYRNGSTTADRGRWLSGRSTSGSAFRR
jgi:hypothetical protein